MFSQKTLNFNTSAYFFQHLLCKVSSKPVMIFLFSYLVMSSYVGGGVHVEKLRD